MILGVITDLIYMVVISLYTGEYFLNGQKGRGDFPREIV
jgi:hypothetical protein